MYYGFDLGLKTTKNKIKKYGSKNSRKRLIEQIKRTHLRIIKQQIKQLNSDFKEKNMW